MSLHVFGTVITSKAVAHNNRGENEGTVSTLQKIIRDDELFSTVSGESIRYALREQWTELYPDEMNRTIKADGSDWKAEKFGAGWEKYIDNDVLGYMHPSKDTESRRGVLEVSRAVSTTPWPGTVTTHFASVESHPRKNANPIPYATEVHDTRYQYTFAMTPGALGGTDKLVRTTKTLRAIQSLRRVGGAHARFLYDFAPEAIVLRITDDAAPRIMFCFEENEYGDVSLPRLVRRMQGTEPDVLPSEVIVGSSIDGIGGLQDLDALKVDLHLGIKAAISAALQRIEGRLKENDADPKPRKRT